jgi:hypothetical protein
MKPFTLGNRKHFFNDLARGQEAERLFIELLTSRGHSIIEYTPNKANIYYDIKSVFKDKTYTFEIKRDDRAVDTENIFIEFESNQKPSGISTTKAKTYVIFIGEIYHILSVRLIKEFIKNEEPYIYNALNKHNVIIKKGYLIQISSLVDLCSRAL